MKLTSLNNADAIELTITGKVTTAEYEECVPKFEKLIDEHGSLRLLMVLKELKGVELGAIWEDMKFGFRHYNDFIRFACVGDQKWEEYWVEVCKPFTSTEIRYFDLSDIDEARRWLLSDDPADAIDTEVVVTAPL